MKIIPFTDTWNGVLTKRAYTNYIVLHHAGAKNYSFAQCHNGHKKQGWSGIGYHFYITKDGTIYEGRPLNTIGAQCRNYNAESIGICAEGNYEVEKTMPKKQLQSIAELLDFVCSKYPKTKIVGHKELVATDCPGVNYPLNELKNYKNLLKKGDEVVTEKIYNTIHEVPEWYRGTIQKLLDKGALKGNDKGELKLTEDICRVFVVLDRLGKI